MKTLETLAKLWLAGHLVDKGLSILLTLALIALTGLGYLVVFAQIKRVFGI